MSRFKLAIFQAMGLLAGVSFSASVLADINFPLPPRFTANGYASDYTVGQADLMLPLQGDAAHNLYVDPSLGIASNSQGYADLGVGYRWIHNAAAILGGYVFAGYSRLDNNARVWVLNPGIEAMGSRWDGHFNAYFPMGDRNYAVNTFQTFGFYTGHSQFDNLYQVTQNNGIGADLIAGYQLFPNTPLKAYLGTYAFAPNGGSIVGGAFGVEYWLEQYLKVFAGYTYDNVRHSTGALGLGVEFGGTHIHRSDPSLEERITDPVQRYIAELGQGSKIPTRNKTNKIGGPFSVTNNIAFFSQSGSPNNGGTGITLANCTFQNPCGPTDLTDAAITTLEGLLPKTTIILEGGGYAAVNVPGGTTGVTLQTGQTIVGNGSTLLGGIILSGGNTLTGIILLPTPGTAGGAGVTAGAGGTITITGSQIGSPSNPFQTGVSITGSGQATITGTTISASGTGIVSTGSNLTTTGTAINVSGGAATGVTVAGTGSFNAGAGTTITVGGSGPSVGINQATGGSATVGLSGTTVTVTGGANIGGIVAGGSGAITIGGGTVITVTGGNGTAGISSTGAGAITVGGKSQIIVTGGDNSFGIKVTGAAAINLIDAALVQLNGGLDAIGLQFLGTGAVQLAGASQVEVTGGPGSIGINTASAAGLNLGVGTLIKVTGNGIGLPIIGINALNLGTVVGNQVGIKVSNTNPAAPAIGLVANGTAGVNLNTVAITVVGNNLSLIKEVLGGSILLSNCTALLNGIPQVCV